MSTSSVSTSDSHSSSCTQELTLLDELSTIFARMHGLLLSEETVASAVQLVADLVADTIDGAVGAGVTLVDDAGQQTTAGASADLVLRADQLQYDLDEGPCLTSWTQRVLIRIDDIAAEARWPLWAPAAAAMGLQSSMSVPLVAGDRALGALKVYGSASGFKEADERRLVMFAAQAAILLANVQTHDNARRLSEGLKEALRTRDLIDMAKGVLMAREGVDETTAFAMLVGTSRRESKKLRDVATRIVKSTARRSD